LVCSDVLGWMGVTLARDDDRLGQAHKLLLAVQPGSTRVLDGTLACDDDRRDLAHNQATLWPAVVASWSVVMCWAVFSVCLGKALVFCGVLGVTLARDGDRLGHAHKLLLAVLAKYSAGLF
jgi:hypothetical protein